MPSVNDSAPDFTLPTDDGGTYRLSAHRGKRQLLVFYPGDNTPVCTAQLCDYRDGLDEFAELNIEVVGISADDAKSHQGFRAKHALPFTLLTDAGGKVAKQYGAWGMLGMKRATFLVDEKGKLAYAKVESVGLFRRHREELLEAFASLAKA
jgi:peroxiredoxin Q/BCP